MRLTFYLTVLTIFQVSASAYSQSEKLTVEVTNKPVKEIFKEIQSKSDYRFFYSDDMIDLEKTISISIKSQSVEKILTEVSSQTGIKFKVLEDNLIVITPATIADEVKGKVVDQTDGTGLPGVNVLIKGTQIGVITDIDGNYSLDVPDETTILVFSFVGYNVKEVPVGGRSEVDVSLEISTEALEEIVVTALSIERSKSSLGYSVTQVDKKEFTQAKLNNPVNSMAGKVSGLQITNTPTGVDGSTRVVLRGVSSLSGNNRPLVVIDGIPVSGGSYGSAGIGGGKDMGDALSDINPDDIETMSVLKGAGAAAIYGSRGANGVILITTKNGTDRKGIGVSVSTNYIVDSPYVYPELQNEYGQGGFGDYPFNITNLEEPFIWSWGPKMEGQTVTNFLGNEEPMLPQGDPFKEFYGNGSSLINTIAFDGGNQDASFRTSITSQDGTSIYTSNKIKKQTVNFRGRAKLGEKFELDGKLTYIHSKTNDRPYMSEDSANPSWALSTVPRNVPLSQLRNNPVDANGRENWIWDSTLGNPYWNQMNKRNEDEKNRYQSLFSLTIDISRNFDFLIRSGFDITNRHTTEFAAQGSRNASNYQGNYNQGISSNMEWNSDFLATYKETLTSEIDLRVSVGGNYRYDKWNGISQNGSNWRVPNFYKIQNLENFGTGEYSGEKEVLSIYGLGTISYADYVYLDLTYRTDWSSTLPSENRSYSFYSTNLSFLFTEALDIQSTVISKGSFRGSYALTGNDTGPYQTKNYYSVSQTNLPYAVGGLGSKLAFPNFKPELTTSWEIGTTMGFLDNRIEFDIAYYDARTSNQILDVKLAPSSGFDNIKQNAGEIKNSGIEGLISASIFRRPQGFNWDVSLNATKNKNTVLSLSDGEERKVLATAILDLATIEIRPGDTFGAIYGKDYVRDQNGNKLIDNNGVPLAPGDAEYKKLGDINPDVYGGLSNSFSYKNFSASFLIDFSLGGEFYSHGKLYRQLMGTAPETLEGREEWYATHEGAGHLNNISGVIPKGYVEEGVNAETGLANEVPVQPMLRYLNVIWFNRTLSDFIVDASNVRLRELVIGYTVPDKLLENTFINRVNFSLVGRNLFFLYNAAGFVDPESGYSSGSFGNAFELNPMPSTRSYGFNLTVNF